MVTISMLIIIGMIICAAIAGAMLATDMPEGLVIFLIIFILFILNLAITLDLDKKGDENAYKQGQIDALTNNIHYELETQADSTKVWVEIK